MHDAPGHARHHMTVLHEPSGTLLAGDAVGVRLADGGLYPTLPPSEIDVEAGEATLARMAELAPPVLSIAHFGPVAQPQAEIALAREQLGRVGDASLSAWRRTEERGAVAEAIEAVLPLQDTVVAAAALARWRMLGWAESNADGLAGWAARRG